MLCVDGEEGRFRGSWSVQEALWVSGWTHRQMETGSVLGGRLKRRS